jgi:thiamine biosynthesis lipoprotein
MSVNKLEFKALGTHWWLEYVSDLDLKSEIFAIVTDFENKYSRFKKDSLISMLSDQGEVDTKNNQELVELLRFALEMYKDSDKKFDIRVGGVLSNLGYGNNKSQLKNLDIDLSETLVITDTKIQLKHPYKLDLGGFGKGWLIDKLSRFLVNSGVTDGLINGGGDVYAWGNQQHINLASPFNKTESIGRVELRNASLAGSSPKLRAWTTNNTDNHHIIDPKTSQSTANFESVFVTADKAVTADSWATILLLSDIKTIKSLAKSHDFEWMVITKDNRFEHSAGFGFISN